MTDTQTRGALVTGGSRGIGRGISLALAREGYHVLINYNRNADAARETQQAIEEAGGRADICQANIADREQRDRLIEAWQQQIGRFDLLVNNAGIAPPKRADILDMEEASYDKVMNTNLRSPWFLTQRVAKIMLEQIGQGTIPGACIVNISSVSYTHLRAHET